MKSIIIISFIIFGCVSFGAQAQTYQINKQNYNHVMYTRMPGDPYNPALMGIASTISGLGQILSGETKRGLAFMGGTYAAYGLGILALNSSYTQSGELEEILSDVYVRFLGAGLIAGAVILNVWSIFDAVKVAKVNNMYFQDMRGNLRSVKVELNPFLSNNNYLGQTNTSAGFTLKITF